MTERIPQDLLLLWNQYVEWIAALALVIALGVLAVYGVQLLFARDYKRRYDIVSTREIQHLWNATILLLVAGVSWVSASAYEASWGTLLARVFISIFLSLGLGYGLQYVLKFYYPFYIEKRLQRLRFSPRISPDGRKMKRLSEAEEDVYLDEGMQAEEDVYSVDYDVWVDETSGYTKIEKYYGRMHADQCPECQYRTMLTVQEVVSKPATETEQGTLIKHFACKYCGHKVKKERTLAKLSQQKSRHSML